MMGYAEAVHRCCREWWGLADWIADQVQRRLQRDYTASQTASCQQFVYWDLVNDKPLLTVRVYAPWYPNGARRQRVVEFSGGGSIQYWDSYNDNDWTRVDRVKERIAEDGKK